MARSRSAGWRFSREQGAWVYVDADAVSQKPVALGQALRLATLNCLHDHSQANHLQHEIRHGAICRELLSLDADVIGLNEVTHSLLERLLGEEWVRNSYTTSVVPGDAHCSQATHSTATAPSLRAPTVRDGDFGNVLLSRIPPSSVEYINHPASRQSHVAMLSFCDPQDGTRPLNVAVCSTHLTAFPWLMEGRRKVQLEGLTGSLTENLQTETDRVSIVMGDFNFHREAENTSIPDGWAEVPSVVELGGTWDYGRNALLAHYLPLRNIYNGFGLGTQFAWPSPMRLDRLIVHGDVHRMNYGTAKARLFADQPIHEPTRGRTPLPQTGPELREAHRSLPWEEYLFPSDHFGILVEFPLH